MIRYETYARVYYLVSIDSLSKHVERSQFTAPHVGWLRTNSFMFYRINDKLLLINKYVLPSITAPLKEVHHG